MKNQTFTASIWREDDWFIAQCLEVDIASQGQSEEEALINLTEALELYFEPPQPSFKPVIRKFEASEQMTDKTELNDELRPEYDETLLKNGIRGKYAKQYTTGTNIIRLNPDIAAAFPSEEDVNKASRSLWKKKDKEE